MSRYLSEMDLVNLERLKNAESTEWCRARWAVSLLRAFRFDENSIRTNWPKPAGKECGAVRKLAEAMKKAKPEQHQYMLTKFAKESPSVRPKDSYPIPNRWGLDEWEELKKEAS